MTTPEGRIKAAMAATLKGGGISTPEINATYAGLCALYRELARPVEVPAGWHATAWRNGDSTVRLWQGQYYDTNARGHPTLAAAIAACEPKD